MSERKTHFSVTPTNPRIPETACGANMIPDCGNRPEATDEPRWVTCGLCKRTKVFKSERAKCPVLVGDPGFKPAK
jgi:hypothetical protein